jgi:hypothetical protein
MACRGVVTTRDHVGDDSRVVFGREPVTVGVGEVRVRPALLLLTNTLVLVSTASVR